MSIDEKRFMEFSSLNEDEFVDLQEGDVIQNGDYIFFSDLTGSGWTPASITTSVGKTVKAGQRVLRPAVTVQNVSPQEKTLCHCSFCNGYHVVTVQNVSPQEKAQEVTISIPEGELAEMWRALLETQYPKVDYDSDQLKMAEQALRAVQKSAARAFAILEAHKPPFRAWGGEIGLPND